jgi:hypothetical protein
MCPEAERLQDELAVVMQNYNAADMEQKAALSGDAIKWALLKEAAEKLDREQRAAAERLTDHRQRCRVCLASAREVHT